MAEPKPEALPIQYEDVVRLISEDDMCDSKGELQSIPDSVPRAMIYTALLKAATPDAQPDPCMLAWQARRREDLMLATKNQDASACLFLRALTLTGQLPFSADSGISVPETEQGLALLTTLAERDAGNGIYPFFKIGPLMGLGRNTDASAAMTEFLHSDKMENPLRALILEINNLGALNSTAYLHSVGLAAASRMPSYTASAQAARALLAGQNPEDAVTWAQSWDEKMQQMESTKAHEPFENLVEVANMKILAKAAWELHASNAPLPRLFQDEPWRELFRSIAVDRDLEFVVIEPFNCRDIQESARRILPVFAAKLHAAR